MGLFGKKFTILVVCRANKTRSAYLHGYMEHYLRERMPYIRNKVRILSAGVQAREGGGPTQVVRHAARLHGFSIRNHRSTPLSARLVRKADVILVMEQWQKDAVIERFPQAKEKTFRLTEYLWNGDERDIPDIPDPTDRSAEDYEEFIAVAHAETDRIFRELVARGLV